MTWPATPLKIRVEISPGTDPATDPSGYSWTDVSAYLRREAKVVIRRGKRSPLMTTVPATCELELNNLDGPFTPKNPTGPWYGQLKRNCPIRVRVSLDGGSTWTTRFTGYVPSWPKRWTPSGRAHWVPISASGVMQRLTTFGTALRGALYRQMSTASTMVNLVAYWPCEDDSDARSAGSALIAGIRPMWVTGSVRFGATVPLSGVASLASVSGGYLGAVIPGTSSTAWTVGCVAYWSASGGIDGPVRVLSWLTPGDIGAWNLVADVAGVSLEGYTNVVGGVRVINLTTSTRPDDGLLHYFRAVISMSGTTINADLWMDGTLLGTATRATTSTTSPTYLRANPDQTSGNRVPAVGHIGIWSAATGAPTSSAPMLGWPGDPAHFRTQESCREEGVPYSPVLAYGAGSELMGAQPIGSLMQILRDNERTDGGLLYELTTGQMTYLRRQALYNRSVGIALSYPGNQVGQPFQPTTDDARLLTDVTARRPGGGMARYTGDQSEGRYEGEITPNTSSDLRLADHARWAYYKASTQDDWFDSVVLELAHPQGSALVSQWLAADIGARVTITGVPTQVQPDTVDTLMVGYTETLQRPRGWRVEMTCEPYVPYAVGVRDTARRDTAGSQLSASATSTATTLSVATTLGPLWVTGAVSFDLAIAGERVTVTNISGASSPQTFTVTRSVNGVVKAQTSGTAVRLWQPAIRAL